MASAFDLDGRTALVTGASRGIGAAVAVALAAHGADVALCSRDAAALEKVAARVAGHGRRALVLPADLTDPAAIRSMVDSALAAFGGLDIVVNNAGGISFAAPFTELRFSGWEKVMRLNTDAVVHVLHAVGPHLLRRRAGSVINVASVGGLGATPALAPYGAAKAAVISLTRTVAVEWAAANVRVNALCPGWTATDLNRHLWEDEAASAATLGSVPMGRWATPEEMAGPAVFLAGDAASFMTGQVLVVDGGQTAV